jgi:hypothetical protein
MAQAYPQAALISDLVIRAKEFKQAYHILTNAAPDIPPPDWPRYFLLSHSIELALKTFLAAHGCSAEKLRKKFGHDLEKLLKEADTHGLVLSPQAHEDIEFLHTAHNNHWARYPKEDGTLIIVVIEEFEKTATELLEQVDKAIYPPITT